MDKQKPNNLISSNDQNNLAVRADISILFAGDSYGLFVFQKTDRLVKAIYLLTGLMSEKEPMRERMRYLVNEMLKNALGMSDRIWGEEIYQRNLLSSSSEISVLFDIAENTKMMSKMNHQIITSELKKFADFLIASSVNYSSAKIAFEPGLFNGDYNYVPDQTILNTPSVQNENTMSGYSIKDKIYTDKGQRDVNPINNSSDFKEKMSFTKTNVPEKKIKDKNNRQDIILSMLKSGVRLTVKDFSKVIDDCSEKTIQRELLNLVSKGVLKKEGERRWTKYFIAK